MTARLYLENPYMEQFSSLVLERIEIDGKPGLILEQTAYYPSSGGQPYDTGTLNDVAVIDVFEDRQHRIVHVLEKPVDSSSVTGTLDWQRRFDHMQQHTGQHLLSQAFVRKCQANTISFHLGETSATIDLDRSGFDDPGIAGVEELANRIIYENRRVTSHVVDDNQLGRYPIRGTTELKTDIRVVEIEDFDFSPCGGTHCSATGEIGILKISRCGHYKGGTRVHFLCGRRALKDYQQKSQILKNLSMEMSAAESVLPEIMSKNRENLEALRRENNSLKKQMIKFEAQTLAESSVKVGSVRVIKSIFRDRDPREIKLLAKTILDDSPDMIILFGLGSAGKATLLFLRSEKIDIDMARLMQSACKIIEGRGGGRAQDARGGGSAEQNLEKALKDTLDRIAEFYAKDVM